MTIMGWSDKPPDSDDENEVNMIKKQAAEYTDSTSIHGLKYIGEVGRHYVER